ncbi:hypothetical protein HanRHA438_Chr09g0390951 [Helianthus annuus]|nr:hypothetical protein HanRHA438_Chr09g0390951 [Helianthus annuus]
MIFVLLKIKSKLPFWSLSLVTFVILVQNLNLLHLGFLWFQFYCHFGPKVKSSHIYLIKSCYFVLFHRGKMVISFLFYLKLLLKGLLV